MKITAAVPRVIERCISTFGYSLKINGSPPRGFTNFFGYVKSRGFQPQTVFDVGVGNGTPWLYGAFPDAHFVLIEPQVEFEPSLKRICDQQDAE